MDNKYKIGAMVWVDSAQKVGLIVNYVPGTKQGPALYIINFPEIGGCTVRPLRITARYPKSNNLFKLLYF